MNEIKSYAAYACLFLLEPVFLCPFVIVFLTFRLSYLSLRGKTQRIRVFNADFIIDEFPPREKRSTPSVYLRLPFPPCIPSLTHFDPFPISQPLFPIPTDPHLLHCRETTYRGFESSTPNFICSS